MGEEERAGTRVVKLSSIVALDRLERGAKLGRYIGNEISKRGKDIRLEF
jgi:hypothetical protein